MGAVILPSLAIYTPCFLNAKGKDRIELFFPSLFPPHPLPSSHPVPHHSPLPTYPPHFLLLLFFFLLYLCCMFLTQSHQHPTLPHKVNFFFHIRSLQKCDFVVCVFWTYNINILCVQKTHIMKMYSCCALNRDAQWLLSCSF